jgi:hypothetical protein
VLVVGIVTEGVRVSVVDHDGGGDAGVSGWEWSRRINSHLLFTNLECIAICIIIIIRYFESAQ